MKDRKLQTRRHAKKGFRAIYARTAKFKQRVSASAASADEMEGDVPSVGIGRALTVILILHLIAIAAIYIGTQWQGKEEPSTDNSVVTDNKGKTSEMTGAPSDGSIAGRVNVAPPPSYTTPLTPGADANDGAVSDRPPVQAPSHRHARIIKPRINPNLRHAPPVHHVRQYVIKQGDTIYRIAKKLHVKQTAIMALNPNVNPRKIRPGMVLKVPAQ